TANATTTASCTTPELVGFVPGSGTPYDVVVDGSTNLAYVASREFGLSVVNVANPSAPVVIGASNPPFSGYGVALSGAVAAVDAGTGGLRLVDVSTPTAPRTVGQLGTTALGGTSAGVALSGTTAYVLVSIPGNPGHTDLVTVNVANPAVPAI